MRRLILRHLIWVDAVCFCSFFACIQPVPQVRTLNLRLATPLLNLHTHVTPTWNPLVGICINPLSLMDLPTIIKWTNQFPILGVLGAIVHFNSKFDRTFSKHTMENLIRRRVLWRLIWVCTACLCPTKRTLCLHGLMNKKCPCMRKEV